MFKVIEDYTVKELLQSIFKDSENFKDPKEEENVIAQAANLQITPYVFYWCCMCGWHVKCTCGNNCCNGGSGRTIDGRDCDCTKAYLLQKYWLELPCSFCESEKHSRLFCVDQAKSEALLNSLLD